MSAVDVVIPCYNYAHYLDFCVDSILAQRGVDVRILIIDDCSPDNTPDVAKRLCENDARVNYVRNEQNLRLIGVSNKGVMEWARAPYTLLISADDALVPGALARAVEVLERHPEVGFVYGPAIIMGTNNEQPFEISEKPLNYRVFSGEEFLKFCVLHRNPVPTPATVTRTATQHAIGGYNPKFPFTSDLDLWMRFALVGPVAAISNIQALYRVHTNNMHSGSWTGGLGDRPKVLEVWHSVVEGCADAQKAAMLRSLVDQGKAKFAATAFWDAGEAYAMRNDTACEQLRDFAIALNRDYATRAYSLRQRLERLVGFNPMRSIRRQLSRPAKRAIWTMLPGHQFGEVPGENSVV